MTRDGRKMARLSFMQTPRERRRTITAYDETSGVIASLNGANQLTEIELERWADDGGRSND